MRRNELSLWDNFFGKSLFDEPLFSGMGLNEMIPTMRMDIKKTKEDYTLIMDVPGVPKENVKIELDNGYLTVSANMDEKEEKKDEDGVWIRRERRTTSQSQQIYVGNVKEEDIKASIENGTLTIVIPRKEKESTKKTINIE